MRISNDEFIVYSCMGITVMITIIVISGQTLEGFPRTQRFIMGMAALSICFVVGALFGRLTDR